MANVVEIFADGKKIERDFTEQELAQIEKDKADELDRLAKIEQLTATKVAAHAKLAALGLTVDDLQALGLI